MAWKLEFDPAAINDLDRLDSQVRNRILTFIKTRLANADDPTKLGRILHGKKYENQWRFRVGDYRIIAEIKHEVVTILVVEVGHRREIYR
jgi:mRNA interferase RelE/StbE